MGTESEFFARIKKHLPGKVMRVENSVNSGFPDVVCLLPNGVSVYIELKSMPPEYPMRIRHLTGIQWKMARDARQMGHLWWFLIEVGADMVFIVDPLLLPAYPVVFYTHNDILKASEFRVYTYCTPFRREQFERDLCYLE
jgi:hypothetical protein